MTDSIVVQRRVSELDISPLFDGYSKVIINIDDDTSVTAGDDTGRTLEMDNPFGSQELANQILEKIRGYQYQPYTASGVLLDTAAEVGDALSASDIFGGIWNRERTFNHLMKADVSAPHDEEIDHEYKFETKEQRKYKREIGSVRASLLIQANQIQAEVEAREAMGEALRSELTLQSDRIDASVSQTGGNNSSFGWSLLSDRFSLYSGGNEVFRADSSGVTVNGSVNVTSGMLGSGNGGFTITASAIYNNISRFGGSQTRGVYIGSDGIQLGQGFKVDSAGNLTANSGTFNGTVRAGSISYGGSAGYFSGGGISGGSIGTSQLSSYVSGGVGGGISFNNAAVYNTATYPTYFTVGSLNVKTRLGVVGYTFAPTQLNYKDHNGSNRTVTILVGQT